MARSYFFQRLCEHDESAIEESFERAREVIEKYYDMSDGRNIYGSKNSYANMLAIYEEKDEKVIIEEAVKGELKEEVAED